MNKSSSLAAVPTLAMCTTASAQSVGEKTYVDSKLGISQNTTSSALLSAAIALILILTPVSSFARGAGSVGVGHSGMGSTVGLANPSRSLLGAGASPIDPGVNPTQAPVPGTSGSPAADVALHARGAKIPGAAPDRDSDSKIDAENRRLDRMVGNICRGC